MPPVGFVKELSPAPIPRIAVRVAVVREGARGESFHRVLRWCREPREEKSFRGITIDVEELRHLADVRLAFEEPDRVVVVLIGFRSRQLQKFTHLAREAGLEVVVLSQDPNCTAYTPPFLRGRIAVARDEPEALLRMAILRLYVSQAVRFRQLQPKQLAEYFALRYRVWEEVWKGMERDPNRVTNELGWEVNYTDLAAWPIAAMDRRGGKLIGCARLVRATGNESPFADDIRRLVKNSPALVRRIDINGYDLPFDMFAPFSSGFMDYYADLMQQHIENAEVSRVLVAPEWRDGGLGEVLMDHLAEFARERAVQRLFLACQEIHERFYRRCGFQRISGLESDTFGNMEVRAIAMHRDLSL